MILGRAWKWWLFFFLAHDYYIPPTARGSLVFFLSLVSYFLLQRMGGGWELQRQSIPSSNNAIVNISIRAAEPARSTILQKQSFICSQQKLVYCPTSLPCASHRMISPSMIQPKNPPVSDRDNGGGLCLEKFFRTCSIWHSRARANMLDSSSPPIATARFDRVQLLNSSHKSSDTSIAVSCLLVSDRSRASSHMSKLDFPPISATIVRIISRNVRIGDTCGYGQRKHDIPFRGVHALKKAC